MSEKKSENQPNINFQKQTENTLDIDFQKQSETPSEDQTENNNPDINFQKPSEIATDINLEQQTSSENQAQSLETFLQQEVKTSSTPKKPLATKEKKSYISAYILYFFFGIFGAHRYYLGKWFTGLLYTFTLGFLFIGWIVDFFLLFFMVKNYNTTTHEKEEKLLVKLFKFQKPEIAPWAAKENPFLAALGSFFRIFVFIIFPPFVVVFGSMFEMNIITIFFFLVLVFTGYLGAVHKSIGSISNLFEKFPQLHLIPFLGEILNTFKAFYEYYFVNRPRNPIYYIFYPITGFLSFIFSKKARAEFRLFGNLVLLIVFTIAIDTIFSFQEKYRPYLEVETAIEQILIMALIALFIIPMFLMPTVSSAFYLKLSGRHNLVRILATIAILISVAMLVNVPVKEPSEFAQDRVEAKMASALFQQDLIENTDKSLSYYVRKDYVHNSKASAILDTEITQKYQADLKSILHTSEVEAFDVLRIFLPYPYEKSALVVRFKGKTNINNILLYVFMPDGSFYQRWDDLPYEIKQVFEVVEEDETIEDEEIYKINHAWLMEDFKDSF